MKTSRRTALGMLGVGTFLASVPATSRAASTIKSPDKGLHVATNTYPWLTFYNREKKDFKIHSHHLLASIQKSGISGYEPILNSVNELNGLGDKLKTNRLEMRSFYVNSTLHDPEVAQSSIDQVLAISEAAQNLGARIVVTNPSPISWSGKEDKSDAQLKLQARNLDELGRQLRNRGMILAYHNHDAELRQGAREFHHMLTATNPENVKLCLDAHWVYRGCGNSEIALFDTLHHYHKRIVELHLRQSTHGIWDEAWSARGDINYIKLIEFLAEVDIHPHMVLEQAVEAQSPTSLNAEKAHAIGSKNLQSLFPA